MHVHEDQAWIPLLPGPDGCLAVIRSAYRKTNGSQQFHQPVPVLGLIVDDQDFGSFLSGPYGHYAAKSSPSDGYSGVATLDRDLEPEYRAVARFAGDGDIASHQARVLAADGQPQAGPLLAVHPGSGLAERLEQLPLVLIRNSRAGIFNVGRQP